VSLSVTTVFGDGYDFDVAIRQFRDVVDGQTATFLLHIKRLCAVVSERQTLGAEDDELFNKVLFIYRKLPVHPKYGMGF
jgi:hypothetical protein